MIFHHLNAYSSGLLKRLPKVHKRNQSGDWDESVRPIINSTTAPSYGPSKWLEYRLRPFLKHSLTHIQDSNALLKKLRNIQVKLGDNIHTFDTKPPYTSIPINEALRILRLTVKNDNFGSLFVEAAKVILFNNYFTFERPSFLPWLTLTLTILKIEGFASLPSGTKNSCSCGVH